MFPDQENGLPEDFTSTQVQEQKEPEESVEGEEKESEGDEKEPEESVEAEEKESEGDEKEPEENVEAEEKQSEGDEKEPEENVEGEEKEPEENVEGEEENVEGEEKEPEENVEGEEENVEEEPPAANESLFGEADLFEDEELEKEVEAETRHPSSVNDRDQTVSVDEAPEVLNADNVVIWNTNKVPSVPGSNNDICLLGLPLNVTIDPDPFDEVQIGSLEKRIIKAKDKMEFKDLKQALHPHCVRIKKSDDGKIISNCRYVEFSDGSVALMIGDVTFEADPRPGDSAPSWLVETTLDPIYTVFGKLSKRRIFKPPQSILETRTANQPRKTKLATVDIKTDSELRLKRQREQQQAAAENNLKKKRSTALDADFLENG